MRHGRSLSERTVKAGAWVIAGKFVSRGIDFLILLILARLLTPADFGLVAMAMTVILIVEAVLELPLVQALVRVPDPTPAMFSTALTLGLLRGATIAVLLGALAWPISVFYGEARLVPLICALALAPVVRGMISPRMALFAQRLDFRREVALDLLGKGSALLVSSALAVTTGSYWAIAAGTITTPVVMVAASYILAPQRPRLTLSEWARFADIVGWNSASQVISALNWQIDKILLGRFLEISAFGRFVIADNIAGIPKQALVQPLMRPLVAAFAPAAAVAELAAAYHKATAAVLLLTAPVIVTVALLAEPVIRIVLGENWIEAAPLLRWLALCHLLGVPIAAMPPLVMAIDRTRYLAQRTFVEFAVTLPAMLIGVLHFGVFGAIAARAIALVAAIATVLWIMKRLLKATVKEQLSAWWRPAAALGPMVAFLLPMAQRLPGLELDGVLILATIATGLTGLALYFGCVLLLWKLCGCPSGAEAIAMKQLASAFGRPLRPHP